uniref:Uncharacterized protein n=1 Tax=Cacopsylla melanoneura TaxID=428564 RepID=A0A8D8YVI5_9HEMI
MSCFVYRKNYLNFCIHLGNYFGKRPLGKIGTLFFWRLESFWLGDEILVLGGSIRYWFGSISIVVVVGWEVSILGVVLLDDLGPRLVRFCLGRLLGTLFWFLISKRTSNENWSP